MLVPLEIARLLREFGPKEEAEADTQSNPHGRSKKHDKERATGAAFPVAAGFPRFPALSL